MGTAGLKSRRWAIVLVAVASLSATVAACSSNGPGSATTTTTTTTTIPPTTTAPPTTTTAGLSRDARIALSRCYNAVNGTTAEQLAASTAQLVDARDLCREARVQLEADLAHDATSRELGASLAAVFNGLDAAVTAVQLSGTLNEAGVITLNGQLQSFVSQMKAMNLP